MGESTPLVLVHGFPLDRRVWDETRGHLPGVRVRSPDLAGFGNSKQTPPCALEDFADRLFEDLQRNGAIPCVAAGLSMGGYVLLAMAERHPDALAGLALVDTKADADTAEQKSGRDNMIQLTERGGSAAVAAAMLPKMLSPFTPSARPEIRDDLLRIMEQCPAETIKAALAAMRDRPDRSAVLAGMRVPSPSSSVKTTSLSPRTRPARRPYWRHRPG